MSVALDTFNTETCADGVAFLSFRKLWEVIAVTLVEGSGMTLDEVLAEACADGVSNLSDRKLLEVIAESAVSGGGVGGGAAISYGIVDPTSAPSNPNITNIYINGANIPAPSTWVWPPGGISWTQMT